MNIILIYFAIKYKGDWDKIYKALEEKERVSLQDMKSLEADIVNNGWNVITIIDQNYPDQLKEAYKPPFVIWLKGNTKLLKRKFTFLISESVSDITLGRIDKNAPVVNAKSTLVTTPMWERKELSRHFAGKLIVADCGVDKVSTVVKADDLVISEYPMGTPRSKDRIRTANRVAAAFGKALISFDTVTNGHSSNLITNFLNLGKEIYCFPGDGTETDGNSVLIQQGANLITKIQADM